MALVYPLALNVLADRLAIEQVVWDVHRSDELSGSGDARTWQAELADPLWTAEVRLAPDRHDAIKQIAALVRKLYGAQETFLLYDPLSPYPQADPDGSILGSSDVRVLSIPSARVIRFSGLPNGYPLTLGDKFQVDWFVPAIVWGFATSAEGWTAAGGAHTPTVADGILSWSSNASNNIRLLGPSGQTILGVAYTLVRVRIRRLAGPGNIVLRLRYATAAGDAINNARRKDLPNTLLAGTDWVTAEFDMAALTAGGDNWITNTITQLDLQAVNSTADSAFEVDWIGVGKRGYFFGEVSESVAADGAGETPAFEIFPHLPSGIAPADAVTLAKPAAQVFVVPGSFSPGTARGANTEGAGFRVMERRR